MVGGEKKNKDRNYGHFKGVAAVKKIVKTSLSLKIPIVTFYVFSTENWKRPKYEINYLFKLIKAILEEKNIIKQGIEINILGEVSQQRIKTCFKRNNKLNKKQKDNC